MIRQILAGLAAFAVLTVGSITGVTAAESNFGSAKDAGAASVQGSSPAKSQSETDPRDAAAKEAAKTASDLAREIAAQRSL